MIAHGMEFVRQCWAAPLLHMLMFWLDDEYRYWSMLNCYVKQMMYGTGQEMIVYLMRGMHGYVDKTVEEIRRDLSKVRHHELQQT